jgi:Rieske Fe-S protein
MMHTSDECGGTCPAAADTGSERRAFLRQILGCAAAALVIVGLDGTADPAFAVEMVTGTAQGNERRYPMPPADGVTIDRASQVMLARFQNTVIALALACPHQKAAVRWLPAEQRFQCSKHDSKYQPTGTYTSGRATRNLDRFPIRRDGDAVVVDPTRVFQSDKDAAGWTAAVVAV